MKFIFFNKNFIFECMEKDKIIPGDTEKNNFMVHQLLQLFIYLPAMEHM